MVLLSRELSFSPSLSLTRAIDNGRNPGMGTITRRKVDGRMSQALTNRKTLGLLFALLILLAGYFSPSVEGLSHDGIVGLAILFAAVALWICETFPLGITGLLALTLAPLLGVAQINSVFSGFGTTTVIFAITVFGLTAIVMKSNIAVRLTGLMVRFAGTDSKRLVLAFMVFGALLSAVMNDSATLVLFLSLADVVLEKAGHIKGKSRLAKSLYLGSVLAVFTGGFTTPAGASVNVLAMGLIEQTTGQAVAFLDWVLYAAPVVVVLIPIMWFTTVKILKPEPISQECHDALRKEALSLGKLGIEEKKTLVMLVALPTLWILGSWVPVLNITTVSVIGLTAMFAPGIRLLTFSEFQKEVPWNIVIMIGAVISLGGIVGATGGVEFLASLLINSGFMDFNVFLCFWIIGAIVYAFHTLVPVGHSLVTILTPPLIASCMIAGYPPVIPAIILVVCCSGNFLLPINAGVALSYRDNVYTPKDLFKTGIIPVFCIITLFAAWVPFAASGLEAIL